jgi:hypothetical protein
MTPPIRIAMWSGPRNISTAMMRAFENRADTAVLDEPFYAAFLAATGIDHPLRAQTLAAGRADPRAVVEQITGPVPGGAAIFYQKHMAHHMLAGFPTDWTAGFRNAFLIREPERVLASYVQKRAEVSLEDIGAVQLRALFEAEAQRLGRAPPVVEGAAVQADPRGSLGRLCQGLGIAFDEAMLSWPAGRRATDGPWAPVWYQQVEASTGFAPPRDGPPPVLPDPLRRIAEAARPHYEALARYALA